jgi:hypothetical protein
MRRKVAGIYVPQLNIARWIAEECGIRAAAQYMRDCGWSLEAALYNLLGIARRD